PPRASSSCTAAPTTGIDTPSLHDALPILDEAVAGWVKGDEHRLQQIINSLIHYSIRHQEAGEILLAARQGERDQVMFEILSGQRSEEHTSELQSRENLVCRLLLEQKKRPT